MCVCVCIYIYIYISIVCVEKRVSVAFGDGVHAAVGVHSSMLEGEMINTECVCARVSLRCMVIKRGIWA